jgi:hypothetical protein
MSILRKQTRSGYTHISNELINADGLSFRAKGIAMVLLSKPDDWIIKVDYLMRIGKEGEKAIRTAMQELAEHGFLMRDRVSAPDGKVTTVTYIADYPAYINVGTVERRIYGYEPKTTDTPVSEYSVSSTSENRVLGKGELLVNPDKLTTDTVKVNRKKNNNAPRPPRARTKKSYHPEDYKDL